jgi:hypothetical protein
MGVTTKNEIGNLSMLEYIYFPDLELQIGPVIIWGMSQMNKNYCFEFGGFFNYLYAFILLISDQILEFSDNLNKIKGSHKFETGIFFRFNFNKNIIIK